MAATAVVVNKGLQIFLSREDAANFAQSGSAVVQVRDPAHLPLGTVSIVASPLCRAAILEHMEFGVPQPLMADALAEKSKPWKGGA